MKSLGGRPHDDWTVVRHVLAIDDLESGEEGPHSPVGEPPYNPMGDVGFSHVGDGAGQGELSERGRYLYPKLVNVRPRDVPVPLTSLPPRTPEFARRGMHNLYARVNNGFAFMSSCLMVMLAGIALSSFLFTGDPRGSLVISNFKVYAST